MKFIIGFFMAWGNFITLPCPYKKWDNELKNMMLAFLPSVGLVIGVVWMGIFAVVVWLQLPLLITGFFMTFYIFAVCGFMHLDGFMDCNDAILSRKPLEDRQRILKDSTVGAFAVVTLGFLLIGWFVAMTTAVYNITYVNLLIIPVVSRGISGLCVLTCKPIGHSQYVEDYKEPGRVKYRIAVMIQLIFVIGITLFLGGGVVKTCLCTGIMAVVGLIATTYARKQLGGMSGDIAGYTICISELAGIMTLAIF